MPLEDFKERMEVTWFMYLKTTVAAESGQECIELDKFVTLFGAEPRIF